MKKNKIFNLTLLFALVLLATTSCSDMLTPDLERYSEKNGKDSIYSYLGILKSMQKIADRTVILGEARGDLVYSTKYLSDSVSQLYNFDEVRDGDNAFLQCADYYNVINQCNFYLHYVDTADVKDEVKYMQKEWAQVQAVRAWTYMQLVQNYGEVPFFTEPVSNSSLGREIAKSGTKANRKNLADLLMNAGLERAYELQEQYGVPYYGRYSNGSVNIDSRICFFPVGLVMADLYLLADNYSKAAESYYDYIRLDASQADVSTAGFMESVQQEGNRYITHGISGWAGRLRSYSRSTNSEIITLIPSAASKNNGEVLTSVQNVYGFKTSVSSGGGVSGSINIQPLEEYRQLMPSNYYLGLSDQQLYCHYSENGGVDVQEYYDGVGDARVWGTAPFCRIDGENFRFIAKRTPVSGTFYDWSTRLTYAFGYNSYYGIPVYRKSQVYLRFAEALNRAGFPQHAFAILKDGLNSENFPTINYKVELERVPSEYIGTLRVQIRTQSSVLKGLFNSFFTYRAGLESSALAALGRDDYLCELSDGCFSRRLINPSLDPEQTGEAISCYVKDLDRSVQTYFAAPHDFQRYAPELAKDYTAMLERFIL